MGNRNKKTTRAAWKGWGDHVKTPICMYKKKEHLQLVKQVEKKKLKRVQRTNTQTAAAIDMPYKTEPPTGMEDDTIQRVLVCRILPRPGGAESVIRL